MKNSVSTILTQEDSMVEATRVAGKLINDDVKQHNLQGFKLIQINQSPIPAGYLGPGLFRTEDQILITLIYEKE